MIFELSRARVDKLVIAELRRRFGNALPISINYETRTDSGFCHIHWAPGSKPLPKRRKTARRGPMRDPKYRAWCRDCVCAVVGYVPDVNSCCGLFDVVDPAHTINNGQSSKGPDSSCVPLCRKHHSEYDANRAAFEKRYGVDMRALAAQHYARFLEETCATK